MIEKETPRASDDHASDEVMWYMVLRKDVAEKMVEDYLRTQWGHAPVNETFNETVIGAIAQPSRGADRQVGLGEQQQEVQGDQGEQQQEVQGDQVQQRQGVQGDQVQQRQGVQGDQVQQQGAQPSYKPMTDAELIPILKSGCSQWQDLLYGVNYCDEMRQRLRWDRNAYMDVLFDGRNYPNDFEEYAEHTFSYTNWTKKYKFVKGVVWEKEMDMRTALFEVDPEKNEEMHLKCTDFENDYNMANQLFQGLMKHIHLPRFEMLRKFNVSELNFPCEFFFD